jgi:paraquat-inducible protein B
VPENNAKVAKVSKIKKLSPIWIIPLVTAFIGLWVVFYYVVTQGPTITITTTNAEGIVGGKTAIKSRSVDIGLVESVSLSEDLDQVVITARLNSNMGKLLNKDSVFWVVKPQIGRDGVSGLGTLLSGVYIELQPGKSKVEEREFKLLDSPPLSSPDAKGLRIKLESRQSGVLSAGDPVVFRGLRVGTIESSRFDTEQRLMHYQLFIMAPFDKLVTTNVRFWQDSGFTFDMSAQGVKLEMSSIQTLLSGGVSFDVPDGWPNGEEVKDQQSFELFPDKSSILDSLYTRHENFIVLFNESIRGLHPGAPVEFKGIRIGTVVEAPYYIDGMWNVSHSNFYIPVLIRIEPDRVQGHAETNGTELKENLLSAQNKGLRASLKSGNLLTGSLFVDFDFYDNAKPWVQPVFKYDYPVIASVSGGLSQLQQKFMMTLDKINGLPLESMMGEMTNTLKESQKMIRNMNQAMASLDQLLSNQSTQALPKDMQRSLNELNKTLKGMQPGSPAYNKLVDDMQRLDDVLREIQPIARTLNEKSNALVFESAGAKDPQPKGAKK